MENPALFAGANIKPSDIARRHPLLRRLANREGIQYRGADDNNVSTDNRRRENGVQTPIHQASQAFRQIDAAAFAKPRYRFSRFGVKRDEIPITRAKEDALVGVRLPIRDAAMHETGVGGCAILVGFRVMNPDCLAGGCLDGGNQIERRAGVYARRQS